MTDPCHPDHSCAACLHRGAPVSRRSVAALVGMSAVGVPILAACGGGGDTSTDSGAATGSDAGSSGAATSSGAAAGGSTAAFASTSDIDVGSGAIFKDQGVVVTQPTSGSFKAFSSTCTHQGCQVTKVDDGTIDCPCHGSEFSIVDGSVEGGPATKALPEVKITVTGDQISLA